MVHMGKPIMAMPIFFILVLLATESSTMAFASEASVNIENQIAAPVTVHCHRTGGAQGEGDLGEQLLTPSGGHYGWGFTPSFWGNTKYHCYFTCPSLFKQHDVKVWDDYGPKRHVIWRVHELGFFRQKDGEESQTFMFPW